MPPAASLSSHDQGAGPDRNQPSAEDFGPAGAAQPRGGPTAASLSDTGTSAARVTSQKDFDPSRWAPAAGGVRNTVTVTDCSIKSPASTAMNPPDRKIVTSGKPTAVTSSVVVVFLGYLIDIPELGHHFSILCISLTYLF